MTPRALALLVAAASCAARSPEPVRQVVWSCPAPAPRADADSGAVPAPAAPPAPVSTPHAIAPAFPDLRLENLRFRDTAECARGVCTLDGLSPFAPASVASEDGASTLPPALAWVHVIRPGATLRVPARDDADLLGVVLVGEASLGFIDPRRASTRATPWSAFMLPQMGAALRAAANAPTALLLVTATGGAASGGARADAGYTVRDLTAIDDLSWNHGAQHARVAFEAPASPRASLGMLFFGDNVAVPEHNHPGTWEVLAVFSAAGSLVLPAQTVDGTSIALAERQRTVTDGSIAYVPASVRHAWRSDGTHPLLAVQVYAPPGPEQRFRALAGASSASNISSDTSGAPPR